MTTEMDWNEYYNDFRLELEQAKENTLCKKLMKQAEFMPTRTKIAMQIAIWIAYNEWIKKWNKWKQ